MIPSPSFHEQEWAHHETTERTHTASRAVRPKPRRDRLRGPSRAGRRQSSWRRRRLRPPPRQPEADDPPLTADQLDSLVAPIALYPDDLLAQVLAASTYPLELMQLQQWLAKNTDLKDKALADAVAKQPWDPSIQSMAAVPEAAQAPRGRHPVDDGPRQRLPRAAEGRHGRLPADAEEGEGQGRPDVERAAEGRDEGRRDEGSDLRPVREPRGHLRALVQPDVRLPAAGLPVPARLLPAVLRRAPRSSRSASA